MNEQLLKAFELKAYNEWLGSLSSFNGLHRRIILNPKAKLAQNIFAAKKDWKTYDQFQRMEVLSMVLHQCAQLFDVPSPLLFTKNSWLQYRRAENLPEEFDYEDSFNGSFGFFSPYFAEGKSAIVISSVDSLKQEGFYSLVSLIAHEMGHAVHMLKTKQFKKEIEFDLANGGRWTKKSIDSYIADPLFTVWALEAYADNHSIEKEKAQIIKQGSEAIQKSYFEYLNERFAEEFGAECVSCIRKSFWVLETGKSDLDYANILITQSKRLVTDARAFWHRNGIKMDVVQGDEIMALELCETPQDALDPPRIDIIDGFISDFYTQWQDHYEMLTDKQREELNDLDLLVCYDLFALKSLARSLQDIINCAQVES